MNIFYLSNDPTECAKFHCDKHVVKMLLETAQLLSSAHHILDGQRNDLYKLTHKNHPCAKWARESKANYEWLFKLFLNLSCEYTNRYGKIHKSWSKYGEELSYPPKNIPTKEFSEPPKCMPDEYKVDSTIESYRNYYLGDKAYMAEWKYSEKPEWFV
jgi:hypothetical protein